jgi:hypothetical protein
MDPVAAQLRSLEKRYTRLTWGVYALSVFVVIITIAYFTKSSTPIIRAKGIVIEDAQGKDRILIGAPIPASTHRVRTDTTLVRKHWASRFGDEANDYMAWYKDYTHTTDGMVIMNEDGFDRVVIGDKVTDPNIGKRMFEMAGVVWNNREGWELGGAGVNTSRDGKIARSIIGLDNEEGEAVHLVALEDGTKGMIIGGVNGRLVVGMSRTKGQDAEHTDVFTGIKYFDKEGKLVWEQEIK